MADVCRRGRNLTNTWSPLLKLTSCWCRSVSFFILCCALFSFLTKLVKIVSRWINQSSTASTFNAPTKYCCMLGGFLPKVTSNGVMPMSEWIEVLYDHSAQIRNARSYCLMTRFMASVWPSIWGWYAELMQSFVPLSLKSSYQNLLTNRRYGSETKLWGMPWSLPDISMNVPAMAEVVWCCGNGPK